MAVTGQIGNVVGRIAHGWALDTTNAEAPISVSLWANNQPIASGMTGLPGHAPGSPENNACGFELALDPQFSKVGQVRYELKVGDQTVAVRHVDYAEPISTNFLGGVEQVSPIRLGGWAVNLEQPDLPVTLSIYVGTRFIGAVQTLHQRTDIQARFGVNQPGGFIFPVPAPLRTPTPKAFRVIVSNTNVEIGGSPLISPPPSRGLSYEGAEALFGVR